MFQQIIQQLQQTTLLEFIAVVCGIVSVYFSQKENVLLYPIGIINTIIYIYISFKSSLFGEALVNVYYTYMSFVGWHLWLKKDEQKNNLLQITYSPKKQWWQQFGVFMLFYISLYILLIFLKDNFAKNVIPLADAFASASAFTAMWLMNKKKIESWFWWIITNLISIGLFYVKGYYFTSIQFIIFFIMAMVGLRSWKNKLATTN